MDGIGITILTSIQRTRYIVPVGVAVIGIDLSIIQNIAINFQIIARYLEWNNRKKILTFLKNNDIIII